jgi:hypothetical protein
MSGDHMLDVVGTQGGKATVETRRARPKSDVETWLKFLRRPETAKDRVEAMVRLFEPDDYPKLTVDEWEALPSTTCELVDGNLYIGGRSYGHGAHARALLRRDTRLGRKAVARRALLNGLEARAKILRMC